VGRWTYRCFPKIAENSSRQRTDGLSVKCARLYIVKFGSTMPRTKLASTTIVHANAVIGSASHGELTFKILPHSSGTCWARRGRSQNCSFNGMARSSMHARHTQAHESATAVVLHGHSPCLFMEDFQERGGCALKSGWLGFHPCGTSESQKVITSSGTVAAGALATVEADGKPGVEGRRDAWIQVRVSGA
jgi:hypothetical protein